MYNVVWNTLAGKIANKTWPEQMLQSKVSHTTTSLTDRGISVFLNCCKFQDKLGQVCSNKSNTQFPNNVLIEPEESRWALCETFVQHVMKEWDDWSTKNFIGIDCDLSNRKLYQSKCQDFLIQTGYFRTNSIEKIVPRLGGVRMGGQYSIRWALSDLLSEK